MNITVLDNSKTIKQLVDNESDKLIIEFIQSELDKDEYSFIVTSENLKFAKEKMADLNKSIKVIDTFRKDKVNAESIAIDAFKDNVKKYIGMINEKREQIKKDVEVYESQTKELISKELALYCEEFIKTQNLREEFAKVDTSDLITLGAITSKGALTKKSKESIESRVLACKSKQDKYDMRLMHLENESLKAGLESPLTITHVQGIIMIDDDNEYRSKLNDLIQSEIERQNVIKENIHKEAHEKAEREAHQKVLDEQNRIASIFNSIAVDDSLSIDAKIDIISDYDFIQFGDYQSYARSKAQSVLSELRLFRDSLEDAQQSHNPDDVNNEDVNIPSDRKVVRIKAVWAIEVPNHVNPNAVLYKVDQELENRDAKGNSFESLEVV